LLIPQGASFLLKLAYYEDKEPGLGGRFLAAVEDATARALAYSLTGS